MLMMTDEKLALFGIVTRAAKRSELTHDEMDKNVAAALDVLVFQGVSHDSIFEYPAILSANTAVVGINTAVPIIGYCAIKLPSELAGMTISVSGDNGYRWVYSDGFMSSTDVSDQQTFTASPNDILVFRVDPLTVSATVSITDAVAG